MSPPGDPPAVQQALQIAQQVQQNTPSLVRAAVNQPAEPPISSVIKRGTVIPPHAPPPSQTALDAARADTRVAAEHVNKRLDTIVPPQERVAGGVYKAGAPGGGRWSDLPPAVLQSKGLGFKKPEAPVPPPGMGHNQPPPGPLPEEPSDDDHLRRMWRESVNESSMAAKHAVSTHNVRPTFTADDWHQALSLPLLDHLWYELSGEKLAENLPGLTKSEHLKMLDILGATSARAKPGENLERTLAVLSQHMRGAPVDTDLTIPSTVQQALRRDHKSGTSALPGNKTGHFSDTLALAGGVPARYPISVNDVWVGKMFGVPDEVMSSNQSLHEPMAKYFNKIRDFYNDRHKENLPFPYQSWNFQAPAWVHLRSKEADAEQGDAYHQVWGNVLNKLRAANIPGIHGDVITRQALMHPGFADAVRGTLGPYRNAPKATVEFNTKQTDIGRQAHDLYHDAVQRGDQLSQQDYLSGLTTAMYKSARGKGHPWDRLKKAVTGITGSAGDITRIGVPTTEDPFSSGGTFEGAVSPNIRVPLKDMDAKQQEHFNAVVGRHLKQDAVPASQVLMREPGTQPGKDTTRSHTLFIPTTEQMPLEHITSLARELHAKGHETSFHRHPNGYQFDVIPDHTDPKNPRGITSDELSDAYGNSLMSHYGPAKILPHDFSSVYTPREKYGKARGALVKRIRDEYLKEATGAGVGPASAELALRSETPPVDFPGGGKKAWDRYRARHDHLAAAETGFQELAQRVNDAHGEFIRKVTNRRAREAARPARPQKAGGGSVGLDMGSTPYSTGDPGQPGEPGQGAKRASSISGMLGGGSGGSGTPGDPANAQEFAMQVANDSKADPTARVFAAGAASSGNINSQGQDKTKSMASGGRASARLHDDIFQKARKIISTADRYPGSGTS